MGEIINKMIIVYHYDEKEITNAREDAIAHFQQIANTAISEIEFDVKECMVSPILSSCCNGEYSFAIMGDCSKEGWETSIIFNVGRQKWLEKWENRGLYILEVRFGEGQTLAKQY